MDLRSVRMFRMPYGIREVYALFLIQMYARTMHTLPVLPSTPDITLATAEGCILQD